VGFNCRYDLRGNVSRISQDVTGPDMKHLNLMSGQKGVPNVVAVGPVGCVVRKSVNFNRDFGSSTKEVENIRPGGMLSPEFQPPGRVLRICHKRRSGKDMSSRNCRARWTVFAGFVGLILPLRQPFGLPPPQCISLGRNFPEFFCSSPSQDDGEEVGSLVSSLMQRIGEVADRISGLTEGQLSYPSSNPSPGDRHPSPQRPWQAGHPGSRPMWRNPC